MADRKIPCADCEDCVPCEMVERCVKHDPAPPTFDNYTRLTTPSGTHIEACPVCSADPEVWQYIAKEGDVAQKVVMCSHDDEIGPHDALAGGGCPLYMPPQSFYRPTIREAVKHWNEYGKALSSLRRKNGWKRAQVLRRNAGVVLPAIDESKLPPRPAGYNDAGTDPDSPLVRYGRANPGSGVLLEPMADGYWTPWHIANELLRASGVKACGSNGTVDCQSTAPEHRCTACPHGVPGASPKPLNGIAANQWHDEGARARCSDCGRYTLNPEALTVATHRCDCGSRTGWSGSFKKPGPDAKWAGQAPAGVPGTPNDQGENHG